MHVLVVIDKRRAELDHKRRAELYHKRRAELDQKRATSLVALKAGVPTTDVAERQIDVAGVFICGNHSSTQYPTCAMRRCAAPQS